MMENKDIILSICISTYNRALRVEKIVRNLLTNKSNKLNIIVVDDCSTDDTEERLGMIDDDRVIVYKNEINLGAKLNWYETLDKGNGKYILHLLDRDWADSNYINHIIAILENSNVGFGYIGNYFSTNINEKSKEPISVYERGQEALCEFACTLVHPTGFLIRRDCWKNIEKKKIFFESDEYGIYPHSYIFALLANNEQAIAIRYRMFEISSFSNMGKNLSHFYQDRKLSYWWTPQAHEYELCVAIKFVSNYLDTDIKIKRKILLNRFKENIFNATLQYKNTSKDIETSRHYGIPIKYVSYEELMKINNEFMEKFINNVKKYNMNMCDENFISSIHIIAEENRQTICADADLYNKEKQIVKFKEYYYLMDAWLDLCQKGLQLYNVLLEHGIKTVAIYGNGKFAKKFREELKGSSIEVKYIIDKNADRIIDGIPVFLITEKIPKVDAIIVTIPDQYKAINEELSQVCSYPIMSLEDIVYSSFEY